MTGDVHSGMAFARNVIVVSAALLGLGCATSASSGSVRYELASRDVGYAWHLHARDGALLCELPCEENVGENSGSYLVVHDRQKAWRVEMPTTLPAPAGGRMSMEPRVGKGSPALGSFGTVLGITGAVTTAVGVVLLLTGIFDQTLWCPSTGGPPTCTVEVPTFVGVGGALIAVGLIAGVSGFYLMEHNKAPKAYLHVLPSGITGVF
jgi:hypothetical protein